MNLSDLLVEGVLLQDEWSEIRPSFGKHGQLKIVGWSGKKAGSKLYICFCDVCSKDPELFGDGYFKCPKSSLVNAHALPCGCARSARWTDEQYEVRCRRNSLLSGYAFIGILQPADSKSKRRAMHLCCKHGLWLTHAEVAANKKLATCQKCYFEKRAELNYKEDSEMIASFMRSGAFPEGTKFTRSEKRTKNGNVAYWDVTCPVCNITAPSSNGNLQKGCRPCGCGRNRQKFAYINLIKNSKGDTIAIKFGVSRSVTARVKEQQRKSIYSIVNMGYWEFDEVALCKKAESLCRDSLDVLAVIPKEELRDGFTETTLPHNIDLIMRIYETCGGTRIL